MTEPALRIAEFPLPQGRASIRVSRVAKLIDVDEATVYRMIDAGEFESHHVGCGGRNIRVYIDSLQAYQEGRTQKIVSTDSHQKPRRRSTRASHNEAVAFLRKKGIVL